MEFLGQGGPNKTIFKVMGPDMKKKFFGDTFFNSTTYLAFHVGLCVWSTFSPPSHQAISNLSTDLDSLVPGGGNKTICNVMGQEIKKKYYLRHHFSFFYLPSTSSPFVCLINFFNPFPPSYFKSKHRFRILGLRRI